MFVCLKSCNIAGNASGSTLDLISVDAKYPSG